LTHEFLHYRIFYTQFAHVSEKKMYICFNSLAEPRKESLTEKKEVLDSLKKSTVMMSGIITVLAV